MLDMVRVVEIPVVLFELRPWLALAAEEMVAGSACIIEISGSTDVHVLDDLVSNAVDASGTTEPVKITVTHRSPSTGEGSSMVEIRVTDSGARSRAQLIVPPS